MSKRYYLLMGLRLTAAILSPNFGRYKTKEIRNLATNREKTGYQKDRKG
jgi:hypothetical protein